MRPADVGWIEGWEEEKKKRTAQGALLYKVPTTHRLAEEGNQGCAGEQNNVDASRIHLDGSNSFFRCWCWVVLSAYLSVLSGGRPLADDPLARKTEFRGGRGLD